MEAAWEIAIRHALGRLKFPLDRLGDFINGLGFDAPSIQTAHVIATPP